MRPAGAAGPFVQRHLQHLRRVQRAPLGELLDLRLAGEPVGDDQGASLRASRTAGSRRCSAIAHGDLVVPVLEAERPGQPAAARVEDLEVEAHALESFRSALMPITASWWQWPCTIALRSQLRDVPVVGGFSQELAQGQHQVLEALGVEVVGASGSEARRGMPRRSSARARRSASPSRSCGRSSASIRRQNSFAVSSIP